MMPAHPDSFLEDKIEPYASAIRKLLKGVIYHDDPAWQQLRDYELPIRDYLSRIGLTLYLDEIGNFAYLQDEARHEDGGKTLPALTTRRPLSFNATLLLVLLRERLDEHELRDIDGSPLILLADEIRELMSVFMGEHPDARRVEANIQTSINRLVKYGYLTKTKQQQKERYIVRPLLRAKIGADQLEGIKERLTDYLAQSSGTVVDVEQDTEENLDAESA